jgi:NAD(P)-dependent dehydrogenase (short-subunit alcohol dehydrogenase family)
MDHGPWIHEILLRRGSQQVRTIAAWEGHHDHGKDILHKSILSLIRVKGGLSGIGAAVTLSLASRGAQIILLTQQPASDAFVADHIEDLRAATSNELIYAEQVDLGSLYSIRRFATKWVDNAPPRRLDTIILCAATMQPRFATQTVTEDGLEPCWGINYLANYHLLSILSPALRAQPPDRDVRIVMATCASYIGGILHSMRDNKSPLPRGREYETSKLALMTLAHSLQRELDAYARPDKKPNNARVILVDPGFSRTPGMRRWLSMGSLWGLLIYLMTWPFWWLVLKSPEMGSQSLLTAVLEAELGRNSGGRFIKECKEAVMQRPEIKDEQVAKELRIFSDKQVAALEKEGAVRRALKKKQEDEKQSTATSAAGSTTSAVAGKNDDDGVRGKRHKTTVG